MYISYSECIDALAKFAEFDVILAAAQEAYPDESFEDLVTIKTDLMTAAETMFASYEVEGMVNAEDLAALESIVESYNEFVYSYDST